MIRLVPYCSLTCARGTSEHAQQVFTQVHEQQVRKISIESIRRRLSRTFGIHSRDQSKEHLAPVVVPRWEIAMYLAKAI